MIPRPYHSVSGCDLRSAVLAVVVLILIALAAVGGSRRALAAEGRLTPEKMAVIDGKPVFLLGLYENPKDDVALKAAVDAGFNLVRSAANVDALDRLRAHGARAWVNLGRNLDLGVDTDSRKQALLKTVNALKDHPALLVWEGPDELLWNCWYGRTTHFGRTESPAMVKAIDEVAGNDAALRAELEKLRRRCHEMFERSLWTDFEEARTAFWKRAGREDPYPAMSMAKAAQIAQASGDGLTAGFRLVREADPAHLLWLNHAPRNSVAAMQQHNRAVDLAGCDIYPVPSVYPVGHSDLPDQRISSVGAYTRRMREAAPGKGVAMVLQGFGWADFLDGLADLEERAKIGAGRRPEWHETRFMAYDAIVNGANALLYWGTNYIEKDSPLWRDLLRLARELTALEPALVAPSVTPGPIAMADDGPGSIDAGGPRLMLKQVGDEFVLIAVNEHPPGVAFTVVDLPADLEGRTIYRLGTDETHVVTNGRFHDGMRSLDVHVYATTHDFEAATK